MSASTHRVFSRRVLWAVVALISIVAVSTWLRWPGFTQGGFASHDVGGILYNSMLLHAGRLPYVGSVEFKAPGTFYLASLLAGPEGRDIATFQVWANVWALLSLTTVGLLGWRLWGPRGAVAAAFLYALHDAHLDSMDANYVTWAQLPQILAWGMGYEASRTRGARQSWWLWMLAGACSGGAALLKRPVGIVFLVVMGWAIGEGRRRGNRWRGPWAVVTGAAFIHVPIGLHYAMQGRASDLVVGYLFNPWATRYLGRDIAGAWPWEGVLASVFFLATPLCLAGYAAVPRRDPSDRPKVQPWLWAWAVAALVGAWAGFRFYKGYFAAVAPPLCLLAAAPWGLLGPRPRGGRGRWLFWIPLVVLLARQVVLLAAVRTDRARPHDLGARRIARHVQAHTDPEDTIWIWGWHLWGVYALSDRLSASPIYKSMGLLTPPNDDTWRRPQSRLRFRDGSLPRQLIADLERSRPAFIVLGSTVPRREFRALRRFLQQHYRLDRRVRVGRVEFWQRR